MHAFTWKTFHQLPSKCHSQKVMTVIKMFLPNDIGSSGDLRLHHHRLQLRLQWLGRFSRWLWPQKEEKEEKDSKEGVWILSNMWSIPIFFKVLMLIHISYFPRWLSFVAAATLASLPSSPLAPSWSTSASLSCSPPWSTSWSLAPASETTSTLSTTTRTTTTTIITITTTIQTTMVVVESAEELLAIKLTKYQRSAEKKQLSER